MAISDWKAVKAAQWVIEKRQRRRIILPFVMVLVGYIAFGMYIALNDSKWNVTDTFNGVAGGFFFGFGTALAVLLEIRQEAAQEILANTKTLLGKQGELLEGQGEVLGKQSELLQGQGEVLGQQSELLEGQGEVLGVQGNMLTKQTRILEVVRTKLNFELGPVRNLPAEPGAEVSGGQSDEPRGGAERLKERDGRADELPASTDEAVIPPVASAMRGLTAATDPIEAERVLQFFALESAIGADADEASVRSLLAKCEAVIALGTPAGDTSIPGTGSETDLLHFVIDDPAGHEQTFVPLYTRQETLRESLLRNPDWQTLGILQIDASALLSSLDDDVTVVVNPWSALEYQIAP
jgi:hypothetical protein